MRRSLCVMTIAFVATAAHAQTMTPHDDQTVTIRAEGAAIGTLLTELAQRYGLEQPTIQSEVEQHPVWIALDDVPVHAALQRILLASGLDFALSGERVIVGTWTLSAGLKAGRYKPPEPSASDADAAVRSGRPSGRPADEDSQSQRDRREAERVAEAAAAEQQALWAAGGDEWTILPTPPVPFIANGENITYLDPTFVPYKMRPEVRALRMAIDVAKIP